MKLRNCRATLFSNFLPLLCFINQVQGVAVVPRSRQQFARQQEDVEQLSVSEGTGDLPVPSERQIHVHLGNLIHFARKLREDFHPNHAVLDASFEELLDVLIDLPED